MRLVFVILGSIVIVVAANVAVLSSEAAQKHIARKLSEPIHLFFAKLRHCELAWIFAAGLLVMLDDADADIFRRAAAGGRKRYFRLTARPNVAAGSKLCVASKNQWLAQRDVDLSLPLQFSLLSFLLFTLAFLRVLLPLFLRRSLSLTILMLGK